MFNTRLIFHIVGLLSMINAATMLLCIPWSLYFGDGVHFSFVHAGTISFVLGLTLFTITRNHKRTISKRDGYLVVLLAWLSLTLSGTLPYMLSGAIVEFPRAFFETVSGYTTTGASILTDVEVMPKSILFWRSLTQWVGGMGIIVLAVAVLPILGIGGMELFMAESPGPTADKLHPRITETAKRLWLIYVFITVSQVTLMYFAGMDLFESLCHSFTTISSGGFGTRNASMGAFSPLLQYIVIIFMFLAGVNFTLNYMLIVGRWGKIWKHEEFRTYALGVGIITLLVASVLWWKGAGMEHGFRDALFQVVSIITTTGFATADYTTWGSFLLILFFVLLFVGGSAGSTSGAIKMVRFSIVIKNGLLELKRILHPNAILPVRFNGMSVSEAITTNILAFFLLYVTIFVIGSSIMAANGLDMMTAIGATATCLGNVGPGIGNVGPSSNFASISSGGQILLSILMLIGRLELFTVLVVFSPFFWRSN